VRSVSVNTPRGEGELQIRWMVEDGSEVKEGDRLVEFDAARLIQTIEERRLKLRQAENDRESRERSSAAEVERKRVAVDKAEVEAEKSRIDAVVPRELRPAVEWRRFQATWQEKKAALEKARLEREAYAVSSRAEIATARERLAEARHLLALTRDRMLPAARDQLTAARIGFETGRTGFADLIEAERMLRDAELGAEQALADTSRRGAELAAALGRIPGLDVPAPAPAEAPGGHHE